MNSSSEGKKEKLNLNFKQIHEKIEIDSFRSSREARTECRAAGALLASSRRHVLLSQKKRTRDHLHFIDKSLFIGQKYIAIRWPFSNPMTTITFAAVSRIRLASSVCASIRLRSILFRSRKWFDERGHLESKRCG